MKVNVHSLVLDASLDEAGFRHDAAALGERLGAWRIGAAVYEAVPGVPMSRQVTPLSGDSYTWSVPRMMRD